jgi:hypothetical protein
MTSARRFIQVKSNDIQRPLMRELCFSCDLGMDEELYFSTQTSTFAFHLRAN